MKISFFVLAGLLAAFSQSKAFAAVQVYDLKADWSDTQNPNGPWSYRWAPPIGGGLLVSYPIPWVGIAGDGFVIDGIVRTTENNVEPGYFEVGDIFVGAYDGVMVRWTAPKAGTIAISGGTWTTPSEAPSPLQWSLNQNGIALSSGSAGVASRILPTPFSEGSGGAGVLQNLSVAPGDEIDLVFSEESSYRYGVTFAIALTDSSIDRVAAVKGLATMVIQMNLQNGIANSLDAKLDAALNVLTDVNVSNDGSACNSLAAFISAVEAQRNKKITSAQADQLIAAAQEIKVTLNCTN